MNWPPHITVATVIRQEDKFLVVEERSDDVENPVPVINQPAGHLEPGETLLQAAVRETLEETGWHVNLSFLVGLYLYKSPANDITYQRICFAAEAVSQSGNPLDPDIITTHWLSLDEIKSRQKRSPLVEQCFADYTSGVEIPLSFLKHM